MGDAAARVRLSRGMTLLCIGYVVILLLLLVSGNPLGWLPNEIKWSKTARALEPVFHLLAFVPLGLFAFSSWGPVRGWVGIAFLVALAAGAEFVQGWMPGRSADVLDAALGCVGVGIGAAVYWAARFHKDRGPKGAL